MEETATDVWKELVEAAKKVGKGEIKLGDKKVEYYGSRLNVYIYLCSGEKNARGKAKWLTVNEAYKMDESFYKRTAKIITDNRYTANGVSTEVLCYRISEIQKCSPEEVFDTLIKLKALPPETQFRPEIIDKIRDVIIEKKITSSERLKEGVSYCQSGHALPEKRVYNAKGVRLNISQYTNQDHTPEITGEDLRKFVIEFIEKMSYRINMSPFRVQGIYNETLDICIVDYLNLHKDLKKWECVRVIYFTSGVADEEIQQEMETVHKWVINSKAFVIVACATDAILRHARENVACNKQNSIMLLCYEHPDEAHIYLKKNPESDEERFGYLKPSSIKYFYYKED